MKISKFQVKINKAIAKAGKFNARLNKIDLDTFTQSFSTLKAKERRALGKSLAQLADILDILRNRLCLLGDCELSIPVKGKKVKKAKAGA